MRAKGLVCAISEVGAADRNLVGGKGASLGELIRAGIRVPPGFAVTVDAFECALRALDPAGEIRRQIGGLRAGDQDAIARASAQVRARIAAAPVPDEVRDPIVAAYRALGAGKLSGAVEVGGTRESSGAGKTSGAGKVSGAVEVGGARESGGAGEADGVGEAGSAGAVGGAEEAGRAGESGGAGQSDVPVAVRSSAVGEDGAEASFAGQLDTYLWVRGAGELLDRVRACWASLYNAEALSYRLRMKIAEPDLAMAVVVQRMVEPRCAGVMFTCSPTTGDRSVIAIEGVWGLGSALVSGDVTPDSFAVSKVTGEVVRRSVAAKSRLHHAGPGRTGVTTGEVPGPLRDQPCLDDAELAALARLGRRVEDHYGGPQDIEWAITDGPAPGETSVVLLQSRPETVWGRRRAEPLATPKPRAVDHVFEQLGRVNVVRPER